MNKVKILIRPMMLSVTFPTDFWPMLYTSMFVLKCLYGVVYRNAPFLFRFHRFNRDYLKVKYAMTLSHECYYFNDFLT